jgi:hypothetical protein
VASDLLNFYRGQGADAAGRSIDEIWAWDHKRLEMVHDFIQWLFPLPEASRFNPDAPLLSAADIAVFRTDPGLQARALRSLDVMLAFFALERKDAAVMRAGDFGVRAHWLEPLNHNHLRLTRIMLFLRHIGLTREADSLLERLLDIAAKEGEGAVSGRTLQFWRATKGA